VYCIVTKADLIGGFVEFWADQSRQDLAGVWGASFAVDEPRLREPARAIESEFEALAERVHARVLDRIPAERDPGRRSLVMQFPLKLRALGARLPLFVDALLRPDAAHEPFVFRGFYFTSATQSGLPAGRAEAGPGGTPPAKAAPQPATEAKSYFVPEVFRSVVLADAGLAAWSIAGARRRLRRQMRAGLIALGVTVLVLVPAIVSYAHNAELASDADATVRPLALGEGDTTPGLADDPAESLLDLVERLDAESSSFAIPGWFGPRASRALLLPVQSVYVHRLHAWLLRRLRPELERQTEAIAAAHVLADAPMSLDDRTPLRESYETVKLYATLVEPKGHVDPAWTPQRLARVWRGLLPEGNVVPMDRLVRHAANYLTALERDGGMAWPNPRSLRAARDRLQRFDIRGLPYRRLLLSARDEPPVRASDIFGGASLEFLDSRGDVQVAGAYTASGWAKVREALQSSNPWPSEATIERWVLGDANVPADDKALREQMRAQYFDEYTRHWMAFLDELRIKTPPNLAAARAELAAFKEADGFYGILFKQFKLNVIHEEPTMLAAAVSALASKLPWAKAEPEAGPKALPPTPVEKGFRPLLLFSGDLAGDRPAEGPAPLEKYRLILSKLKAALDAPSDQPNPDAQTQFSEAGTGVAALLDGVDEPTRSRLWRLLMPPVKGGVQAAKVEGVGSLSDDWKSNVWTPWDGKLSGRFPFRSASREQTANFADFTAFFKPNDGILWGFEHARLANWVERSGSGDYVPKKGADPLSPELFECLSIAQEITDAFYREGDDPGLKLSFQADWSAPDVSAVKVSVGAKETPLPRAQWSLAVRWLGEDTKLEWIQGGRPTQELGRHAFSLLDLLQQLGGLRSGGARGVYVADFPPLTLKLRAEGKVDALRSDFFARLRCPREIEMVKR
jgi:type VI secretion system protein ImpL